jgi:3-oxoacyl-[acyl-carrier-protein] synthase-1
MGFRSQVEGSLKVDLDASIDRARAASWAMARPTIFLAMQQALTDSGLEKKKSRNERTGLIMGSGGPSTQAIVAAADTARANP